MALTLYKITSTGATVVTDGTSTPSEPYTIITSPATTNLLDLTTYYTAIDRGSAADFHPANFPPTTSEQTFGDGVDALAVNLSNDNVSLACSSTGTVLSYSNSSTDIYVYQGTTALTYDGVGTTAGTWTVTATAENVSNVTFTNNTTFATTSILTSMANVDVGKIVFTISGTNNVGATFSIVKIQTFNKLKQGTDGTAASYILISGQQAFKGSGTINLTATLYGNLSGYIWEYWSGAIWASLSGTNNTSTYSLSYSATEFGSASTLRIRCRSGSVSDELTISKVYDGLSPGSFSIDNSGASFKKSDSGTFTPSILVLSTSYQNISSITGYQWQLNGVNIVGATSSTLTITAATDYASNIVTNTYKCTITGTINGVTGSSLNDSIVIPVVSDGKAYLVTVESTNGTEFRIGQGKTTLLKAHVFLNGVEVTTSIDASWFKWRRVSVIQLGAPYDDTTWNNLYSTGYKQISIDVDAVNSQATFFCDIINPT